MLSRIHIQNFAIASEAEVELSNGMTVLTGETGAGKSILIDALDLVLGDRADTNVIRHGADRATINASFILTNSSPALDWLKKQELDDGDECHLRRIISAEGRSRAFINNAPANLSSLKELGEMLIEIHGQHEHQSLMKAAKQRQQLDTAGDYQELLSDIAALATDIKQRQQALDELQNNVNENSAQLELLRYQIQELETLDIAGLDIAELVREHEQASNIDSLRVLTFNTLQQLTESDENSIDHQINQLIAQLEPWLETSPELKSASDLLHDINALTVEAGSSIQKMQDKLEADPQRLLELDNLLGQLHELARKHHIQIEALPDLYNEKRQQLEQISQGENDIDAMQAILVELKEQYYLMAAQLNAKRLTTAEALSLAVTDNMQALGMQGGRFEIQVKYSDSKDKISAHGLDEIDYLVSANPGQPLQPVSKVASGGELSRISLAITVICASSNNAPTMIFDEVDSGIGGGVAEIVGKQLLSLGQQRQVLCVTHLPQVAAQGHHHFRVVKTSTDEHTESRVIALDEDTRVQEIGRMLGGVEVTEQSLAHARELLDFNNEVKAG
jgi:DNA repair protein RecN (Recombination protein N)